MSVRALMLGMLLVVGLSSATYFGQAVLQQGSLAAGLFPVAVIGAVVVLVLGLNPLLCHLRGGPLGPGEAALIASMGMVACYWPGSVFNNWLNKLAMPAHWQRVQPDWTAAEVMSYVPGGSPRVGEGHIHGWGAFARALLSDRTSPWSGSWLAHERQVLEEVARRDQASLDERRVIVAALNRWLDQGDPDAAGRARAELVAAYPEHVRPPPAGGPLLPARGRADPAVTDALLTGMGPATTLRQLPWDAWIGPLAWWIGLGLLLAVMLLCLSLIVHPQWSGREQLAYPVVTFLNELTRPGERGGVPAIARQRLFWMGLAAVLTLRLINGLNAWFPETFFVKIPLSLDFTPLRQVFLYEARVPGSNFLFAPVFDPLIIAFAFFLSRAVAFSLGLVSIVWVVLGGILIRQGVQVESSLFGSGPVNLINFGAYLGGAAVLLYTGRAHYAQVVAASVGLRRPHVPGYCVGAARMLGLCGVVAMVLLTHQAGLDWPFALISLVMILLSMTVLSRIHVETGALYLHAYWFSFSVLPPLVGAEAVGPTNLIVMALVVLVLTEGTQSAVMPYLVNSLKLMDRVGDCAGDRPGERPGERSRRFRCGPGGFAGVLVMVLVVSAAVAATATMYWGYTRGTMTHSLWAFRDQPSLPFHALAQAIEHLRLTDRLEAATSASGWQRLGMIRLDGANLGWVGLGLALTIGCAVLRLRLAWWPIHPFLFLMLGTFFGYRYAASFLAGWAIKAVVVGLGGERMYHQGKPLMVGIIAGKLLAAFAWTTVGWSYHWTTGLTPRLAM